MMRRVLLVLLPALPLCMSRMLDPVPKVNTGGER